MLSTSNVFHLIRCISVGAVTGGLLGVWSLRHQRATKFEMDSVHREDMEFVLIDEQFESLLNQLKLYAANAELKGILVLIVKKLNLIVRNDIAFRTGRVDEKYSHHLVMKSGGHHEDMKRLCETFKTQYRSSFGRMTSGADYADMESSVTQVLNRSQMMYQRGIDLTMS